MVINVRRGIPVFIALVTALSPAAVGAFAPAAMAADACTVNVSRVEESWGLVSGDGSYVGCPGFQVQIEVQRSRWYGWEAIKKTSISRANQIQRINYNCLGTGAHDFRLRVQAHSPGTTYEKTSNILKDIAC